MTRSAPAATSPAPDADLLDRARAWTADDPDPQDRAELASLLTAAEAGDPTALRELQDMFSGPLAFGTAGLRGRMGPGESRMNLAVVSRAARGLADHLNAALARLPEDGGHPGSLPEAPLVVVGHDARHRSRAFAERTAAILHAAGLRVRLTARECPTPLIAFATRALDADAGVMVTASHNPAADNGFKVYLGGRMSEEDGRGVQIVPPSDEQIAAAIATVGPVREISVSTGGWGMLGEDVRDAYLERICDLPDARLLHAAPVRIVHTSLHGVGHETMSAAFARLGLGDVHPVAKQADPDPDFPTVAFPNPEEPGVIDLALELARTLEADVVIANDPDADRCAAAVPDPHRGDWRMLTGDELGVLLGAHLVAEHGLRGTLARSVVSSRWLDKVAEHAGLPSRTTLTGFKWIARTPGIGFGYEEAIGSCVLPDAVRDKDGLSAALMVAEMAALARSRGTTLVGMLDDLARRDGLYATSQLSLRVQDLAERDVMMARLRERAPADLAGSPVLEVQDLAAGSLGTTGLPPTEGMLLLAEDDARVIVRPSGTEPKLKCYLEVHEQVPPDADDQAMTAIRERAAEHLDELARQMRGVLTGA